jgi:hypothetical protein
MWCIAINRIFISKVKGKIASANTEQEQRKVMEGIQKNKS